MQYAQEAAASGENTGREGRFKYRIAPSRDGRGSLAVFLDVSEDTRSMLTVAVLSLLAGAGCWLAAFLAVMLLSKRAISPIAVSYTHLDVYKRQMRFYRRMSFIVLAGAVGLLALVPFIGVSQGDAKRWISLGFTTFQPSEIAKIGVILYFAAVSYTHLPRAA